MRQQAPAEELLNSLWCSESLSGRTGHKGVCLAVPDTVAWLILQGAAESPTSVCSPPLPQQGSTGQQADRREFSIYNDFLENFLSCQPAPEHT